MSNGDAFLLYIFLNFIDFIMINTLLSQGNMYNVIETGAVRKWHWGDRLCLAADQEEEEVWK